MTTPKIYENEVKQDEVIMPTPPLESGATYIQGQNTMSPVGGVNLRSSHIGQRQIVPKDGSEIQKVIDKLHGEGGGTVYLENGRYILNDDIALYSNVYLQGESRDLTILDFVNNSHSLLMKGGNAYTTGTITCPIPDNTHSATQTSTAGAPKYLSAVDSASLSITGNLTLECWVKVTTQPSNKSYPLLGKTDGGDGSGQASYSLAYIDTAGTKTLQGFISVDGGQVNYNLSNITQTLTTNTWIHVAMTITPANAAATKFEFFLNGVSIGNGTPTTGGTGASSIFDGNKKFCLGIYDSVVLQALGGYALDGLIDDARVWNDIRTVSEISSNMNIELAGSESNLQAYWKLNNSLVDLTSNGNTLTNNNGVTFTTDVPFLDLGNYTSVLGIGTTFTSSMVGQDILLGGAWYPITAFNSTTSLTIAVPYSGTPISSGTYAIATTISDCRVNDVYITNALYGIDMQYAKDSYLTNPIVTASAVGYRIQTSANLHFENPRAVACNSGMELTSVSLLALGEYGGLTSLAGNGLTLTSCLNIDITSCYISGNSGNGVSLTSCEDIAIHGIFKANGAKGIELISGNNNITTGGSAVEDNTSDGIKLTATSTNSFVQFCSMARNGGYGLNILSGCNTNSIVGNNFASNTSGKIANGGTGNIGRGNVTVTDFG